MADPAASAVTLRLLTPQGLVSELRCRSVQLPLMDRADGRGGGSYAVFPGHTRAVLALEAGLVRARAEQKDILKVRIPRAFASVEGDVVTILADSAETLTE